MFTRKQKNGIKKKCFVILIFLTSLSSCKNENVSKNKTEELLKEFLVLGESSKKTSEFPLPWKNDSYFVDITYPELKLMYDSIKEPNFCKHYLIVRNHS